MSEHDSNYPFHRAIRKYKDKLIWTIYKDGLSEEESSILESSLIQEFNTFVPNGYNATLGGEGSCGFVQSEESRKKMSIAHKGLIQNKTWRENKSKSLLGHSVSDVTREKIRHNLSARLNKSGYIGVSFSKTTNKFVAQITLDGKKIHIGVYSSPEEASAAYQAAYSAYQESKTIFHHPV